MASPNNPPKLPIQGTCVNNNGKPLLNLELQNPQLVGLSRTEKRKLIRQARKAQPSNA